MARSNDHSRDDDGYGVVLDDFPEAGPAPRHPWDTWTDGRPRVIRRGRHFDAETTEGMRATLYSYARRNGLIVRVRLGRPETSPAGRVSYVDQDRFLTMQFQDAD